LLLAAAVAQSPDGTGQTGFRLKELPGADVGRESPPTQAFGHFLFIVHGDANGG